MPYGSMSDELAIVLNGHGITHYGPQDDEGTWARVDVFFAGALDESFDVSLRENDVEAIVVAIFEHITTRDYAHVNDPDAGVYTLHVSVDAYETNGDNYNERIHVRAMED